MKAFSYIRFSSPEQETGDSLRRQTEYSEKVAAKLGLQLDDRLHLTDRGISAYTGDHRTRGALGEFLRLVEDGSIEAGSVLIIEALDRLSREGMLEAIHLLTGILLKGIDLYTAMDDKHFQKSTYDLADLIISATKLQQGHEESEKKSIRLKEAWGNKRKAAGSNGHKLTKTCPAWLKLSKDRKSFEVIPEATEAVSLIFHKKLEGVGVDSIVRLLNKPGNWQPPGGLWMRSYIEKIIRSRRVLGEFQPCRRKGKEHIPEGEPILNYYPTIVTKELFDRMQAGLEQNSKTSGHAGGRIGPVNNLFSHLAKCSFCGSPMAIILKGPPPKGYSYLVCDHARRGSGCQKHYIRYDKFENLILTYCRGLDPSSILPGRDKVQTELSLLRNQLQAINGGLVQVQEKIDNLVDHLELGQVIKDRLQERMAEKASLETQKSALTKLILEMESQTKDTEKQLESIQELISLMGELEGQDRTSLRLSLRQHLRGLIRQINVDSDRFKIGILFRSGERRLLTTLAGSRVNVHDTPPKSFRMPSLLWSKPYKKPV